MLGNLSEKNYSEQSVTGKVKWFNVKAGFGFITRSDNGQDVYAHYTAISKKNPSHRLRSLAEGELVRFNLVEGENISIRAIQQVAYDLVMSNS